jgi:phosphoglycolate phosphatase
VVLVGDTVHDFEVATAMGVGCVLVAAGHHARERLSACACPVVESLEELLG